MQGRQDRKRINDWSRLGLNRIFFSAQELVRLVLVWWHLQIIRKCFRSDKPILPRRSNHKLRVQGWLCTFENIYQIPNLSDQSKCWVRNVVHLRCISQIQLWGTYLGWQGHNPAPRGHRHNVKPFQACRGPIHEWPGTCNPKEINERQRISSYWIVTLYSGKSAKTVNVCGNLLFEIYKPPGNIILGLGDQKDGYLARVLESVWVCKTFLNGDLPFVAHRSIIPCWPSIFMGPPCQWEHNFPFTFLHKQRVKKYTLERYPNKQRFEESRFSTSVSAMKVPQEKFCRHKLVVAPKYHLHDSDFACSKNLERRRKTLTI